MAQRRMFSLKVIDTDKFLEMPQGARLLYYDLGMRADDDGFVNNPKKIIQMVGASWDDFKILCAKEYIIPFESGVVVIREWRIHNLIRHDRYTETEYLNEKARLDIQNNKYTHKGMPDVIPDGNQLAPQVRLGKDRLGKDNKESVKTKYPTLEEWFEYCKSNGYNFDFESAWHHYNANGWKQSNGNKIQKWESCVVTCQGLYNKKQKNKPAKPFKDRNAYLEGIEQLVEEGLAVIGPDGQIEYMSDIVNQKQIEG